MTLFTYVPVGTAVLAWSTICVLMFVPVKHLYDHGQGRFSAVAFLLLFPFMMAVVSAVLPLYLARFGLRMYALLVAATSLVLWIPYCYCLAVGMAI
jgi:hypothetical protein